MDGKAYFDRGLENFEKGKYEDAISDFTEAIERKRNSYGAHFQRGKAHLWSGDFRKAIIDYETAISLGGDDASAIGDAYFWNGLAHFSQARRDWEFSLKYDPSDENPKRCLEATKGVLTEEENAAFAASVQAVPM